MTRIAIIIESSNVEGETDLPGARVDQRNWVNFLKSELGGSWCDIEIILLSKPYSNDVDVLLDEHKDKYCFVAFSGHGSEGSVALNDHYKNFPSSNLKPRGEKGTLLIDSCRGVEAATEFNFSARQTLMEAAYSGRSVIANSRTGRSTEFMAKAASLESRSSHSVTWRLALMRSKSGLVEMLACARGESADEDPNYGGYYTSLLLQSADLWQQAGGLGNVHTTLDAHNHASAKMPPQQNPEYRPTDLTFPFAVSV